MVPLRTLRRRLKDGSDLGGAWHREVFRTRIKAIELEAERLQQEALFGLAAGLATTAAPSVEAAARANVAAYEQRDGACPSACRGEGAARRLAGDGPGRRP